MNERIKELMIECYSPYSEFDHEKFAHLLINETLQVARAGAIYGPSMDEAVHTYFGLDRD